MQYYLMEVQQIEDNRYWACGCKSHFGWGLNFLSPHLHTLSPYFAFFVSGTIKICVTMYTFLESQILDTGHLDANLILGGV